MIKITNIKEKQLIIKIINKITLVKIAKMSSPIIFNSKYVWAINNVKINTI